MRTASVTTGDHMSDALKKELSDAIWNVLKTQKGSKRPGPNPFDFTVTYETEAGKTVTVSWY